MSGRGNFSYRVQERGHKKKMPTPVDVQEMERMPVAEKMPTRRQHLKDPEDTRVFDTVMRIERRVDTRSLSTMEFADFTTEFASTNRQFAVKNVGSMAVTYFSGHHMRKALREKFADYGLDIRTTESIHKGFLENFRQFTRTSLGIYREAEKFDHLSESYHRFSDEAPLVAPNIPPAGAWVDATASLSPTIKVLDSRYVVADLSGNQFLEEERSKIWDFLRHDEGLKLENRPYIDERIPHLTLAETRKDVLHSYPVMSIATPEEVGLQAPNLYAKIGVPIYKG